ncbi:MAG: hypothetical protein KKF44_05110, partial [Nanoarchaeota archaeon]|nr:hypothetical protein [Nanoarchaeota archaeon]
TIQNAKSTVSSVAITPTSLYVVKTPINCSFIITDPDTADTVYANVTWYYNSSGTVTPVSTYDTQVTCTNGQTCYTDTLVPVTDANHNKGISWICSAAGYDGTDYSGWSNSSEVMIENNAPNITAISLSPTTAYTSNNIDCLATINDYENSTLTVEYWWYNNTVFSHGGNSTGITTGSSQTANTLSSSYTGFNQTWNCTVRAYDGWDYSDGYNSTTVTILNTVPTHDEPDITPSSPTTAQNLTCNWNNVYDADGHNVTNITTWYKNNNSILRLYYPFEGGSNATYTKDYSGEGHDGTVVGAVWNRTGGQVGGAYDFNGSLSYIQTALSGETINNFTAEIWTNIDNVIGEQFIWGPSLGSGSNFCAINNLGGLTLRFYADGNYRASVTIAYDRWYHAAVTLDSSNLWTFYVNGTTIGTYQDGSTHSNQANADYIFLGHALQGSHDGLIDEVKVYHEALSADQIYQNYLAGLAGHNPQIIVSNETSVNDEWLCEVTPNDGYVDGITKNSSSVTTGSNPAPTWVDDPVITPSSPSLSQNLTCSFNVTDANGDNITNITNWYKNNATTTLLYMPFEGGSSSTYTKDYSGRSNNGVGVNSVYWNQTGGKIGGAYDFDGLEDHIIISSNQDVKYNGTNMSYSFWVKIDPGETAGYILSKPWNGNGEYNYRFLYQEDDDYNIDFYLRGDSADVIDGPPMQKGEWYHYVYALDIDRNVYIYVNGRHNTTDTHTVTGWTPPSGDNEASLAIGTLYPYGQGWGGNAAWSLNGSIDEVKIYNITLSADQVWAIYSQENNSINSNIIVSDETSINDQWLCSVTPNDGYRDGTTKNSSAVTVTEFGDTPTVPTNITCNGGTCNATFTDNVVINCSGSTDLGGDTITYVVEKGNESSSQSEQILFEDVENVNWTQWNSTKGTDDDGNTVTWTNSTYGGSGYYMSATRSFWIDDEDDNFQGYLISPNSTISENAKNPKLSFWIRVNTENDYDACWIEYSINGGSWTLVDDSMIDGTASDYSGYCGATCPSSGHVGWEGALSQFQVNISIPTSAKGNDIAFRWVAEADANTVAGGTDGCWVDDINITNGGFDPMYTVIGNHTEENTFQWNFTEETGGEVYEAMRCRAIDLEGSQIYSSNFTMASNLTIGASAGAFYSEFACVTTDFNGTADITSVTSPTLEECTYGKIRWLGTVNAQDADFDT